MRAGKGDRKKGKQRERGAFQSWLPLPKEMEPIAQLCGMERAVWNCPASQQFRGEEGRGSYLLVPSCLLSLVGKVLHYNALLSFALLGYVSCPL